MVFFSKTISFLFIQIGHMVVAAPNKAILLRLFAKQPNHRPNMLKILCGFGTPRAKKITPQTIRANRQSKNRCLIVSISWQKQHVLLPCQLRLAKLSFVKMTPLLRYHKKTLFFRGAFSCHNRLFRLGTSHLIKA